jgi:hypothetical protein
VLEQIFTEEEVCAVIMKLPNNKAPGPHGFTGLFYKLSWDIIKGDIMNALNAFWCQDSRSFNHVNDRGLYDPAQEKGTSNINS